MYMYPVLIPNISDKAGTNSARFRISQTHRPRDIWQGVPGTQEGHKAHLCNEGAVEKGNRGQEGGRTYYRGAQNFAALFGVTVPGGIEVQFPDGCGFVPGDGFQEWRRAVLASTERDAV